MKAKSRKVVVLPRSEYARLHHYTGDRYVVDAIEYSSWSIGRKLRDLRREAGLTRADVALGAKLPLETISRIENGHADQVQETTVRKVLRVIERAGKAERTSRQAIPRTR